MPEYFSRERVYELGPDGQPHRLKYPVGWPIPEEEARRQGLIPDDAEAKAVPAPPAHKARRRGPNKATPAPQEG